jgi:serine/threonine-protein kinase
MSDRALVRERARSKLGEVVRGKYRLDRVLGIGGMATVFAATHRNKKQFALKVLHPELSAQVDVRHRFLREGYVANTVGHAGAVVVLDDDVADDGGAFLVMELLDGEALDVLAGRAGGTLPADAVVALADQLLDVLVAAHAKGIVHRDLKPANLFLTTSGQLKVLDFGVARLRDASGLASSTTSGQALGTPAFMPPEQALGKATLVDEKSDVWSVGATMFALLSGSIVHEAETVQELLVFAATKPARSLAAARRDAPAALVAVVDRALAMDKAERWPSAGAMQEALARASVEAFGARPMTTSTQALLPRSTPLPCPSEDVLAQLLEGSLPAPARVVVDDHLDRCTTCRSLVAALSGEGASMDRAFAAALASPPDVAFAPTLRAGDPGVTAAGLSGDAVRARRTQRRTAVGIGATSIAVIAATASVAILVPREKAAVNAASVAPAPPKIAAPSSSSSESRAAEGPPPATAEASAEASAATPAPSASPPASVRRRASATPRAASPPPSAAPATSANGSAGAGPWDHL